MIIKNLKRRKLFRKATGLNSSLGALFQNEYNLIEKDFDQEIEQVQIVIDGLKEYRKKLRKLKAKL